jgi:hypothetical protein
LLASKQRDQLLTDSVNESRLIGLFSGVDTSFSPDR